MTPSSKVISKHTFILPFTINDSCVPHYTGKFDGKLNVMGRWREVDRTIELPYLKSNRKRYDFERFYNDEFLALRNNYKDFVYQFDHELTYYEIVIDKGDAAPIVYDLPMEYAMLRFLDDLNRLGFLVIRCRNEDYPTLVECSEINQYGRHLYDPFFCDDVCQDLAALELLKTNKKKACLDKIDQYRKEQRRSRDQGQRRVRRLILCLLKSFFDETELHFFDDLDNREGGKKWLTSVIDDRMLVQSSCCLEPSDYEPLANVFKEQKGTGQQDVYHMNCKP